MAKGGSEFAATGLEWQEIAGEYRRAVAGRRMRPRRGYCGSRPSCTSGRSTILVAGSMTCSTSSMTRPSSSWRGAGCGATEGSGRPGWTGSRPRVDPGRGGGVPAELRADLKARRVRSDAGAGADDPQARHGKLRRLGIPTARDRTVQAALKLVLEPIFEADFQPCSYGFRPEAPGPGRDRRDSPVHVPLLRVGVGR